MPAKTLSKLLTSPSKVAHALDWKKVSGSILSLSIHGDRMDLAVASHPTIGEAPQPLPSIPIKTTVVNNRKQLCPTVGEELLAILQDWQVCGLVVNWPVQKEGWCGAPCGKVLHTLDQLVNKLSSRPICLWDEEHHLPSEDEWGRSPIYGEASNKTVHIASEEQYKAPATPAADVWNDFCRAHWPELYYTQACGWASSSFSAAGKKNVEINADWLDNYEDTAAYTAKAAL